MRVALALLGLVAACTPPKAEESACVGAACDSDTSGHDLDSRDSAGEDSQESGTDSETGGTPDTVDTGESGGGGETADTSVPDDALELCINEFMPSNITSLTDETGAYPDWIELHNPGAEDVLLDGWSLTDDRENPGMNTLAGGLTVPAGGWILLYADALPDLGSAHLNFALSEDGEEVGLFAPDGRGSVVRYGEVVNDISLARVPDCCTGSDCWDYAYRGTPGETNGEPEPDPDSYVETTVFAEGSTWSYYYDGTEPDGDWTSVDYDDAAWASGAAPLGYGDSHQVTVLDYGADESNKYITAYFRVSFDAAGVSEFLDSTLEFMLDDGMIVYLNGAELTRDNLSTDPVNTDTTADASVSGTDETAWNSVDLDPTLLLEGSNTLAVEVHQQAPDSSDMTLDMRIVATVIETDTGDTAD